jgi:hypothetical protein
MPTVTSVDLLDQAAIANSFKDSFDEILELLCSGTRSFLNQCERIWKAKQLSKEEWAKIKQVLGWTDQTATPYIKVWDWIRRCNINTCNLELLDSRTLMSLCHKRYEDIWNWLQSRRMTVQESRELMADINKTLKKPKKVPKVLEWEKDRDGFERLVIRLESPDTGSKLEKRFRESGEVSISAFLEVLMERSTLDEQVVAQHEFGGYLEQQVQELPKDIQAEIAKEELIHQLNADYSRLSADMATYHHRQDPTETMMYNQISQERELVVQQLASFGLTPIPRKFEVQ